MLVNILGAGLALIIVAYAASCSYLYFFQEKIIFQPTLEISKTPGDANLDFDAFFLDTSDHIKIHAWYVPAHNATLTILFFHGNTGNMSDFVESLTIFNQLGLNTLMIDYRGYGLSEGTPSEQGSYLDGEAALSYLRTCKGLKLEQIILVGRSLGGGIATELATRHNVRALVLESTYTSMPAIAQDVYPFMPAFWLVRHRYNNLKKSAKVHCPLLIVHSKDDEYINIKHGRSLYQSFKSTKLKRFIEISGSHESGFRENTLLYTNALKEFIIAL